MLKCLMSAVGERTVLVVDVEYVVRCKVIRYVYVFPAIAVDIADIHAQPKSFGNRARLLRYVGEVSVASFCVEIITVQPVGVSRRTVIDAHAQVSWAVRIVN